MKKIRILYVIGDFAYHNLETAKEVQKVFNAPIYKVTEEYRKFGWFDIETVITG